MVKQKRKDIQRQQNKENEGKSCESHLNEPWVVCHLRLPTLTHLTDTLNISHWTINGPISRVCVWTGEGDQVGNSKIYI